MYVFEAPQQASLAVQGSADRFPIRRIFCVGRNYAAHAREMGKDPDRDPPFFFLKPADAVVDDGATIPYPPQTENLHYEAELVVAIGAGGREIPADRALEHVWGYAVGNDLTRRDMQNAAKELRRPWDLSKGFDRSAVIGPLVSASEIWGIGSKLSKRLADLGIETGLQLADTDSKWIRKHFSVVVERTVRELNGVPCHTDLLEVAPAKKQILCSKSFGTPVTDLDSMLAAVSHHAARATEKLRKENRECGYLATFMSTSRYRSSEHYANQRGIALPYPTADTREICKLWR